MTLFLKIPIQLKGLSILVYKKNTSKSFLLYFSPMLAEVAAIVILSSNIVISFNRVSIAEWKNLSVGQQKESG